METCSRFALGMEAASFCLLDCSYEKNNLWQKIQRTARPKGNAQIKISNYYYLSIRTILGVNVPKTSTNSLCSSITV